MKGVAILIFGVMLMMSNCDGEEFTYPVFDVSVPISLIPEQAVYERNDTISLIVSIDTRKLFDFANEEFLVADFMDFELNVRLNYRYEQNGNMLNDRIFDMFYHGKTIKLEQQFSDWKTARLDVKIGCPISRELYQDTIGLIPKVKGIFLLSTSENSRLITKSTEECGDHVDGNQYGVVNYYFNVNSANEELEEEVIKPPNVFESGGNLKERVKAKEVIWIKIVE